MLHDVDINSKSWFSAWWRTLLCSWLSDTTKHWLQRLSVVHWLFSATRKSASLWPTSECRNRLPDDDLRQPVSHCARDAASRLRQWIWTGN